MKIFYGVAGEGMGHAIRSKVVLDELTKKHDVFIFCGGVAYPYFSHKFPRVIRTPALRIVYRNNSVCTLKTGWHNFSRIWRHLLSLWNVHKLIKKEKPDLILNDFTYQLSYLAWVHNLPHVSIDNVHSITDTDAAPSKRWSWERLKSKIVIRLTVPYSTYRFITSFFPCKAKKNSEVVKPLIRKEVLRIKPKKKKNHVFVYQTSKSNTRLIKILKSIKEQFILYGFNRNKTEGNLVFKKFNEKEFFQDLSSSKAVISNGGFTLISEALYFKKPILALPVRKQYEQLLNAYKLQKHELGRYAEEYNAPLIKSFLQNTRTPKRGKAQDVQKLIKKIKIYSGITRRN